MLEVTWTEESNIAGWSDLIPDNWCRMEGKQNAMRHFSRSPRGRLSAFGFCDVAVKASTVTLDYRRYKPLNDRYGWEDGVMQIHFKDARRTMPQKVGWKANGGKVDSTLARAAFTNSELDVDWSHDAGSEGDAILSEHIRREKKPELVKAKIAEVLATAGELRCEACTFSFAENYSTLGVGFCEVHHVDHLRQGRRKTELDRLAVLCSNCHRMIHKMPSGSTVAEFKPYISRKA